MKILFISAANPCLSVMAAAILRSINPLLSVSAADIHPEAKMHPKALEVMTQSGLNVSEKDLMDHGVIADQNFDFIITIGDGTSESVPHDMVPAKRRLHLGFRNPFSGYAGDEAARQQYYELKEEMQTELDYFNRHFSPETLARSGAND